MAIGQKTGGRKKGTPNKKTQDVQAKLDAIGCDPITSLALLAQTSEDEGIKVQCLKEIAQYVLPKRRAIEHSGTDGGPLVVEMVSFKAE